ncbi:MAG: MarR family winged helix-turn-helix transcriptional regulator [Syntrophorhabdaceae bacterium]
MGLTEELQLDHPIESIEHESLLNIVYTGTMIDRASFKYFHGQKITVAQFNVLVQLKYAGNKSLSQSVLVRRLVVNKADMTGIIDRLEKTGFVKRNRHPSDRRINMVTITREGEKALSSLEAGYFEGVRELMSGIPKNTLRELNTTLEKVRRNIAKRLALREGGAK